MSTYGTAVVIDVPRDVNLGEIVAGLRSELFPSQAVFVRRDLGQDWVRVTAHMAEIELLSHVRRLLATAGAGRAAIAEDNDEFGALWVVLQATADSVRTVHRRYVLNADPSDSNDVAEAIEDLDGNDPRVDDVAGPEAAAAAAVLFGVDPTDIVAAERRAESAFEQLGVVGGPFPWWDALGLTWPGPDAGDPLD